MSDADALDTNYKIRLKRHIGFSVLFVAIWVVTFEAAELFEIEQGVSIWYLTAGLKFAYLVAFGLQYVWLVIVVGMAFGIPIWLPDKPLAWILTPIIPTIFYALGAHFIRTRLGNGNPFEACQSAIGFLLVASQAMLATAMATIGFLVLEGSVATASVIEVMVAFWLGDFVGIVLLAPPLLFVLERLNANPMRRSLARMWPIKSGDLWPIAGLMIGTCTIIALAVFIVPSKSPASGILPILAALPILVAALRFRSETLAWVILIVSTGLTFGVKLGLVSMTQYELQAFAVAMAVAGYVICATFQDLRSANARLTLSEATLEKRVEARTQDLRAEVERRRQSENALITAKAERDRAYAQRTDLMTAVSHDLKQPVLALSVSAKLWNEMAQTEEQRGLADQIKAPLAYIRRLAGNLLDLSKHDSGAIEAKSTTVPLQSLLADMNKELSPLAREKGLDLRFVPTTAIVQSDRDLLERILRNLIDNAVRYTQTGKILVGVRRIKQRIRIDVIDTGPGFRQPNQTYETPADRNADQGAGLGLEIVRRFSNALGAEFEISSEPGQGTRASIILDAAHSEPVRDAR